MKALPASYSIEFSACAGFGNVGRTATIFDLATGDSVMNGGCGETDLEAMLETLVAEGWGFDRAFDMNGEVIRNAARVVHHHCE